MSIHDSEFIAMRLKFLLAIVISVIFMTAIVNAQIPYFKWAKSGGGSSADYGKGIATDGSGNSYATGSFSGTVAFGSVQLTSAGSSDVFVVKYDPSGNVVWAKSGGGSGWDGGVGIATDGSGGNIYVIGQYSGTVLFGTIQLISTGGNDVFIVKYNSSGNVIWAKSGGGTSDDYGQGIAADGSGNIYITGGFNVAATFGTMQLTSVGYNDVFVIKYNSSGSVVWARSGGSTILDYAGKIIFDVSGNIFITGSFQKTATFGSFQLTSNGNFDIFIVKYNSSGGVVWAKNGGGTSEDEADGIVIDGSGNALITGRFGGTATFGSVQLISNGGFDVFIVKYNSSGGVVWARNCGGSSIDRGYGITADGSGNAFIIGYFSETASFGSFQLASVGSYDVFVAKYNSSGSALWAKSCGGTNSDFGYGITADGSGNVFITGYFDEKATFGYFQLTSAGGTDFFNAQIGEGLKPTAITESASLVTATSARLNGSVNPNGDSATVKFQYDTTTSYCQEIFAIPSRIIGNSSVSVYCLLSTLEPNQTYHYRVIAINKVDTSYGEDATFTTSPAPVPESPSLIAPANASTEVPINPTLTWNTSIGAKTYGLRIAVDSLFKKIVFAESNIGMASRVVSNLAYNSTYYWQVNAKSDGDASSWSKYWRFTTKSSIDLNYTVLFPDLSNPSDYSSTDYKIVGLPGVSDLSVKTVLAGLQNQDWQAYWDNGNPSENPKDYLVAFDGTSDFVFKAGRAFWIIKKGTLNISYSVKAVSLDDSGLVNIKLHDGWNLITNPFSSSVNWSEIKFFNNFTDPIWKYNGAENFAQSDIFEPYVGYYFFANSDLDFLMIPYPHSLGFQKNSIHSNNFENRSWRIHISLSSGKFVDKTLSFGLSEQAKAELDKLDFRKPRGIGSVPTACFIRPEWDPNYSTFAVDMRPEFDEIESWKFEVRDVHQQNSRLDFKGIEQIPEQMEIYLVDDGGGESINLREQPSYAFMGIGDIMKFRIIVGKPDLMEAKLSEISMPKQFALGNNYPNPFSAKGGSASGGNPATSIPVEIPVASDVTLKIYNVLGQQVITIYQGYVEPGRYQFTWDGRDQAGNMLSSGVYILRLSTNSRISLTSKMILMQ